MPDLSDLIARVEALEGPDREVDRAVAIAAGDQVADDSVSGFIWRPAGPGGWSEIPRLTASLDAALALVERVLPGRARFLLSRATTDVYHDTAPDLVPRLARNLILALLRALAMKEKDREE